MTVTNYTLPPGLYKRGDSWHARVNLNGKRYAKSLKCKDFETAIKRFEAFKQNIISIYVPQRHGFLNKPSTNNKNWMQILYSSAKKRAAQKNLEFNLSFDDIKELGNRSGMKCEVSGIPFSWDKPAHCRVAPYIPSIDRIDSTKGYTKDNVRLICWAVNISLSDWGDNTFIKICKSVAVQILNKA